MSVNSKMTAIADEIRELSGTVTTKTLDDMAIYVREANDEINEQSEIINQIVTAINDLPEFADPIISVDSNGLITAEVGDASSTYQLAFQPAKTIVPSTISQIAVSSGYYTGGNIIIDGDSNLVAENIKNGVSIFGVSGTLSGYSGNENEDAIIMGNIGSYYANDRVTSIGSYAFYRYSKLTSVKFTKCNTIGSYAFYSCSSLKSASFPACTNIGSSAFYSCSSLTSINFPSCTNIGGSAFYMCSKLTSANFPVCTNIGGSAFYRCFRLTSASFPACTNISSSAFYMCSKLTSISFPSCTNIGGSAFYMCSNLTSASFPACTNIGSSAFYMCFNLSRLYLNGSSVCTLSNSNAFLSTPYAGYSASYSGIPYIYVPASLASSYRTATNWTYFSSYISGN